MSPAGLLLLVLIAALVIAEAKHGRGGAVRWMRAKFLGDVA